MIPTIRGGRTILYFVTFVLVSLRTRILLDLGDIFKKSKVAIKCEKHHQNALREIGKNLIFGFERDKHFVLRPKASVIFRLFFVFGRK